MNCKKKTPNQVQSKNLRDKKKTGLSILSYSGTGWFPYRTSPREKKKMHKLVLRISLQHLWVVFRKA